MGDLRSKCFSFWWWKNFNAYFEVPNNTLCERTLGIAGRNKNVLHPPAKTHIFYLLGSKHVGGVVSMLFRATYAGK